MENPLGEAITMSHDSSTVASTSYYPAHALLSVQFNRGGTYTYHPVSSELHQELVQAPSIGRALDQLLKKAGVGYQPGTAAEFPL